MPRQSKGIGEKHKRIIEILNRHQEESGYPPTIREIGEEAGISSTSVVNYYLNELEKQGYIARDRNVSRGLRVLRTVTDKAGGEIKRAAQKAQSAVEDVLRIPVLGPIFASHHIQLPASDFSYFDAEMMVEVARSSLPARDQKDLFALRVRGDSMIDAMVNDGDLVIMKRSEEARNGEMVAVWLSDRDETTLKYFYNDNNRIRLQPANPTMGPIYVDNPKHMHIQGKVVMVIRNLQNGKK